MGPRGALFEATGPLRALNAAFLAEALTS